MTFHTHLTDHAHAEGLMKHEIDQRFWDSSTKFPHYLILTKFREKSRAIFREF